MIKTLAQACVSICLVVYDVNSEMLIKCLDEVVCGIDLCERKMVCANKSRSIAPNQTQEKIILPE